MKDEILIKFILRESTAEENVDVNQWIELSEENRAYLTSLQRIWTESKGLAAQSEVDVNAAWGKFKDKATVLKPAVKLNPVKTWMRIAAVFVLAIGGWLAYSVLNPSGYKELNANSQVLSQLLPDGSELTLNKFSHVEYASNFKNNRSVKLDSGDVFFQVAKDKSKPFIIEVDDVTVEVVGTSFNIKHLNKQTEVVVETGIVKVKLGTSEVLLQKGERVVLPKGTTKLEKLLIDNQLYNYYRSKLFVADNTPLPVLVAILNEAYGSKLVVEGAAKDLTISTTLPYEKSLNDNLQTIIKTFENLKLKRNQNEIILSY